jgi:succinate dehydrogenase assembly factor 1
MQQCLHLTRYPPERQPFLHYNIYMAPISGLQRQVFSLYRSILRAARGIDSDSAAAVRAYARERFRASAHLGRGDVARIEHLLRCGFKQLDALRSPGFVGFSWQGSGVHE